MAWCDLHVHSYYSDGTLSPGALVELAEKRCMPYRLPDKMNKEL